MWLHKLTLRQKKGRKKKEIKKKERKRKWRMKDKVWARWSMQYVILNIWTRELVLLVSEVRRKLRKPQDSEMWVKKTRINMRLENLDYGIGYWIRLTVKWRHFLGRSRRSINYRPNYDIDSSDDNGYAVDDDLRLKINSEILIIKITRRWSNSVTPTPNDDVNGFDFNITSITDLLELRQEKQFIVRC